MTPEIPFLLPRTLETQEQNQVPGPGCGPERLHKRNFPQAVPVSPGWRSAESESPAPEFCPGTQTAAASPGKAGPRPSGLEDGKEGPGGGRRTPRTPPHSRRAPPAALLARPWVRTVMTGSGQTIPNGLKIHPQALLGGPSQDAQPRRRPSRTKWPPAGNAPWAGPCQVTLCFHGDTSVSSARAVAAKQEGQNRSEAPKPCIYRLVPTGAPTQGPPGIAPCVFVPVPPLY